MKHDNETIAQHIRKLSLKRGDILIVDAHAVEIDQLCQVQSPEIDFTVPVIPVYLTGTVDIEVILRSCDLATLKRVVAEMEARTEARTEASHG